MAAKKPAPKKPGKNGEMPMMEKKMPPWGGHSAKGKKAAKKPAKKC